MSSPDPRLTLAGGGLAARALEGLVAAEQYRDLEAKTVRVATADLRAAPDSSAEQNDQLLFGEGFDVLDTRGAWAFGQARRGGYVGWVQRAALAEGRPAPTHWVSALGTVALVEPSVRGAARMALGMNALVRVEADEGAFARVAGAGWIPRRHLSPLGVFEADPAGVAERWRGTAYLWGGRDQGGIDCSGLVQQALFACGLGCPRDSDQQARLGRPIEAEALARNDLVVWAGHIGVMVDAERVVHASGVQMQVVIEPLAAAVAARADAGPPTAYRRL